MSPSAGNCPKCACVLPAPTLTLTVPADAELLLPPVASDGGICPSCGASVASDDQWCGLCLAPLSLTARFGIALESYPVRSPPPDAAGPTIRRTGVRYATWDQRVGASLLDAVVMVALPAIPIIYSRSLVTVSVLAAVALACWNVLYLQGTTGKTLGKARIGITLVGATDGQPIGVPRCCWRQLAHGLDGVFYLGYLWPIWDHKHQTFADKICRTVVVIG